MKALTTVDLVAENIEMEKENYVIKRDNTIRLMALLGLSWLGIAFLIWLAFFHFPKKEFVWTSNAGAVCNVIPISEPHIDQQIVVNFALDAAVSTYTYNYVNYRRAVTEVADRYFTTDFRNSYLPAFGDSAALKSVLENYFIVSAVNPPNKPPQVKSVGRKAGTGAYYWNVLVPLKVSYSSGRRTNDENIVATVRVIRVDPSRPNPTGIAVDSLQATQMLN